MKKTIQALVLGALLCVTLAMVLQAAPADETNKAAANVAATTAAVKTEAKAEPAPWPCPGLYRVWFDDRFVGCRERYRLFHRWKRNGGCPQKA